MPRAAEAQRAGYIITPWHWSWLGGQSLVHEETFKRRNTFNISFSASHYSVGKKKIPLVKENHNILANRFPRVIF